MGVLQAVRKVRRFMARLDVGREPGVVAVSGGADSVALLRALIAVRTGPLTVAHFNHKLRGGASEQDAAFVGELAGRFGLPFRVGEADVAKAAVGENLEATARRLRYDWLNAVADEVGAKWIATGHTLDDQAETVLHRLIRGTGMQGLRGIAADRRAGGVNPPVEPAATDTSTGGVTPPARLIRPFLSVTRAEVLELLRELNLPHREDDSNSDARFTRNRIRAELLPLLKTFNPEIVASLGRLAGQADEAHDIIVSHARALLEKAERPRAGGAIILDADSLGGPAVVVRSMLRLVWEREGWPVAGMDHAAWERAFDVARRTAGACDFPGGVAMRHRGRVVQLERRH
ncbi:MAG TPA: tRNA lysidine(34) synthetase TilS [Gemmataceae bacterium]|nr:tRNA lysidine(34) synthetase TilS [Gemmataceae bacterium]